MNIYTIHCVSVRPKPPERPSGLIFYVLNLVFTGLWTGQGISQIGKTMSPPEVLDYAIRTGKISAPLIQKNLVLGIIVRQE